jgi:hypothetical protein
MPRKRGSCTEAHEGGQIDNALSSIYPSFFAHTRLGTTLTSLVVCRFIFIDRLRFPQDVRLTRKWNSSEGYRAPRIDEDSIRQLIQEVKAVSLRVFLGPSVLLCYSLQMVKEGTVKKSAEKLAT